MKIIEGYKETEMGVIPEDWEVRLLNDLSTVTRLAGAEYSELWEVKEDGEIIALRGFNIGGNRLDLENVDRISLELSERLIRSKLFKNDIVFPCVGTIGKAYRVLEDNKFHINQNIAKITPNNQIDAGYLTHYLLSTLTIKQILKFNTSSSQPNVLVSNLRRFDIIVPPLPEQQRISEILSITDEHIERLDKTIEDYQLLKKGIMHKLLTEGIGHTEFKDTEIGRIPKDWEIKRLNSVLDVRDGTHDSPKQLNDGIPLITSKNLKQTGLDLTELTFISEEDHVNISKRSKVDKGDIIFAMIGTIGNPVIMDVDFEFSIKNVALLKFNKTDINNIYVKNIIDSSIVLNQFMGNKTGGVQKFISLKVIRNTLIPVPPLSEQKQIAEILSQLDGKIELHQNQQEDFIQLKKALMQQLLTGKIRTI